MGMKLLLFIAFIVLAGMAHADQYVDDFADKPGYNEGTVSIQTGVCAIGSYGWKALSDSEGRPDLEWVGGGFEILTTLLLHIHYISEGGNNARDAWIEQGQETIGALAPIVIKF